MQYDDDDTTATAPLIRKRNLKQIRYHVHIVIGGKQLKSYDEYAENDNKHITINEIDLYSKSYLVDD